MIKFENRLAIILSLRFLVITVITVIGDKFSGPTTGPKILRKKMYKIFWKKF